MLKMKQLWFLFFVLENFNLNLLFLRLILKKKTHNAQNICLSICNPSQRLFQDPIKHLWWSFQQKLLLPVFEKTPRLKCLLGSQIQHCYKKWYKSHKRSVYIFFWKIAMFPKNILELIFIAIQKYNGCLKSNGLTLLLRGPYHTEASPLQVSGLVSIW